MIYFNFFCFAALFAFISIFKGNNKYLLSLFYFIAFLVAFLIGLRGIEDEITRVFVIYPAFQDFAFTDFKFLFQKGLISGLVSTAMKSFGLSSQWLMLSFAFTSIFIHAIFYRKFTQHFFLAFLIYLAHEFILKDVIQVRYGLACVMTLPAIYYLCNNKIKYFFITALLAGLIHYVGFLIFLLIFLRKKIKIQYILLLILLSITVSSLGLLKPIILNLSINGIVPYTIAQYLIFENMNASYSYNIGILHPKLVQQFIVYSLALALFYVYGQPNKSKYYIMILNAYLFSILVFLFNSEIAIFSTRFAGVFNVVEPILLASLASYFRQYKTYLNILLLASIMLAYTNYVIREQIVSYKFLLPYSDEELADFHSKKWIEHRTNLSQIDSDIFWNPVEK
jgi:hypothetical protein